MTAQENKGATGPTVVTMTAQQMEEMREVFSQRVQLANGAWITLLQHANATMVRMMFHEADETLGVRHAVTGVVMSLDNFVQIYNAMGSVLSNLLPNEEKKPEEKDDEILH